MIHKNKNQRVVKVYFLFFFTVIFATTFNIFFNSDKVRATTDTLPFVMAQTRMSTLLATGTIVNPSGTIATGPATTATYLLGTTDGIGKGFDYTADSYNSGINIDKPNVFLTTGGTKYYYQFNDGPNAHYNWGTGLSNSSPLMIFRQGNGDAYFAQMGGSLKGTSLGTDHPGPDTSQYLTIQDVTKEDATGKITGDFSGNFLQSDRPSYADQITLDPKNNVMIANDHITNTSSKEWKNVYFARVYGLGGSATKFNYLGNVNGTQTGFYFNLNTKARVLFMMDGYEHQPSAWMVAGFYPQGPIKSVYDPVLDLQKEVTAGSVTASTDLKSYTTFNGVTGIGSAKDPNAAGDAMLGVWANNFYPNSKVLLKWGPYNLAPGESADLTFEQTIVDLTKPNLFLRKSSQTNDGQAIEVPAYFTDGSADKTVALYYSVDGGAKKPLNVNQTGNNVVTNNATGAPIDVAGDIPALSDIKAHSIDLYLTGSSGTESNHVTYTVNPPDASQSGWLTATAKDTQGTPLTDKEDKILGIGPIGTDYAIDKAQLVDYGLTNCPANRVLTKVTFPDGTTLGDSTKELLSTDFKDLKGAYQGGANKVTFYYAQAAQAQVHYWDLESGTSMDPGATGQHPTEDINQFNQGKNTLTGVLGASLSSPFPASTTLIDDTVDPTQVVAAPKFTNYQYLGYYLYSGSGNSQWVPYDAGNHTGSYYSGSFTTATSNLSGTPQTIAFIYRKLTYGLTLNLNAMNINFGKHSASDHVSIDNETVNQINVTDDNGLLTGVPDNWQLQVTSAKNLTEVTSGLKIPTAVLNFDKPQTNNSAVSTATTAIDLAQDTATLFASSSSGGSADLTWKSANIHLLIPKDTVVDQGTYVTTMTWQLTRSLN